MMDRIRQMRDEKGFTLIELLIVIIILGILAAIVVFAVGGISERGQTSACAADKKTLRTAQEANFAQHGSYATEATLVTNKFLAEESNLYNTAPSGTSYTITVQSGSPCTP